jgi:hypothetical protein
MQRRWDVLKRDRIALLVLPAHKLALARIAQTDEISEAAVVRRLIRAEAQRRHIWLDDNPQSPPAPRRIPNPRSPREDR